jgi:competence protein ComEA
MKQVVRDYLTFNKRERNGVFVLIFIITVLLIYLNISENFQEKPAMDLTKFGKQMNVLNAIVGEPSSDNNEVIVEPLKTKLGEKQIAERFDFDPNELPDSDWKRLGLTDKQIRTIKHYEAKGGKFRKKEDLKKMYCIKPELYASLENHIQIEPSPAVFENGKVEGPKTSTQLKAIPLVDLNSADSAMLTTIKGIGPFYAKTIVKYRNSLGGFYSKEQLMEVWKFDQEKYNSIEKFVTVDPTSIRKININTCEAEQLKMPYIKWNVVNAIVNYRKQHGKFKSIEDIKLTDLVDDETLRKIEPYLSLGE